MRIAVITLFPEMLRAVADYGVTGRAVDAGLVDITCFNPRDFTEDVHKTVDGRPYGGGPGMVMLIQPLRDAIREARKWATEAKVIYLSPQGERLEQKHVSDISAAQGNLILLAGRYEGIDERLVELEVDTELSVGDYVLSGGELPAMVLIDALIRQIPGALGHSESAVQDSFVMGLLDHPHYTRPEVYDDKAVPDVLLSGNHKKIADWRHQQARQRTEERRPDILDIADRDK